MSFRNMYPIDNKKNLKKVKKKARLKKKRPTSNTTINIFYDNPQLFFTQYNITLKNSSYFDICGNSICMHYFYVLYEDHKKPNKKTMKNYIINNKILSNINIYQKYFSQFFQEHKDCLSIQDICLETPLHKIAKFHDKTFFAQILQKLNFSGVLTDKLLSIKNVNDETCYNFIIDEIKDKYGYYIYNDYEYNILKNSILIMKNIAYSSIFNDLSIENKMIINNFLLKNNYILQKRQIFDNLYSYIDKILKNEKDVNVFEYIYNPFYSAINYLNILFNSCQSNEDFNKLLLLVNQLLYKKDYKPITDCDKNIEFLKFLTFGELCVLDHLRYTLGKMNSSKIKGKYEIGYCIKLIKNYFKNIINSQDKNKINRIITFEFRLFNHFDKYYYSCDCKEPYKAKNSIIYVLLQNENISFDKKEEILSILNQLTNDKVYKELNEYYSIYYFFKVIHNSQSTTTQIRKDNIYIKKIIDDLNFVGNLYENVLYLCDNYDKNSLDKYIELLNNFIIKEDPILLKNYKIKYNLSYINIKELLNIIYIYKKENYSGTFENEILSEIEEDAKVNFILSDNKLSEYTLLDNFQREKKEIFIIISI